MDSTVGFGLARDRWGRVGGVAATCAVAGPTRSPELDRAVPRFMAKIEKRHGGAILSSCSVPRTGDCFLGGLGGAESRRLVMCCRCMYAPRHITRRRHAGVPQSSATLPAEGTYLILAWCLGLACEYFCLLVVVAAHVHHIWFRGRFGIKPQSTPPWIVAPLSLQHRSAQLAC